MPTPRIPRGGTRGTVYRDVARLRFEDAETLRQSGRYNGAIYLAGYAVECQIKFAYCRNKGEIYLPAELEVHDWEKLVTAAGLLAEITRQISIAGIYSALVDQWGPSLRYRTAQFSASEANKLYKEIQQLYQFLKEIAL